jgi:D-tyrosyl-tRNA(Tyr) deacylase
VYLIGLIQRVNDAEVVINGETVAAIGIGLLVLIGVQRGDGSREAARLAERVLQYRVFADAERRMNLDVRSAGGSVLLVPQFTLAADTRKGNRPGFSRAAAPELGERLFASLVAECRARYAQVSTGRFGADMQVRLTNDGPVTFWLEVAPAEDFSAR